MPNRARSRPRPCSKADLTSLPLLARGKVRDNYAVGDDRILMVASDRLSAFDVVMGEPIPGKGELLTRMALFWFDKLGDIVPNHLTGDDPRERGRADEREQVRGRSMLVKRLQPLPVEAVVRGYLAGSGWKEYQQSGVGLRRRAAGGPEATRASCPSRSSRRRPRPRSASTTRTSLRAHGRRSSARRWPQRVRDDLDPPVQRRRRPSR